MDARVNIVAIGDMGEASLLRLQLEALGAEVRLCPLGRPSDVLAAFDFYGGPADVVVVCAHGDEGGIVFPEMAAGIDTIALPGDRITAELIGQLNIGGAAVISTACDTGRKGFATAFRAAGVAVYIAPVDDPEGADVPVLLGLAFHKVLMQGKSWEAAIAAANSALGSETRFAVFGA